MNDDEGDDQAGHRRHRVGGAHHAVDDPRLAPDLGHDPAGLDRDEAQRRGRARWPASSRRLPRDVAPAPRDPRRPRATPGPGRCRSATMIWKARWTIGTLRPVVAGELVEALHLGVEVAEGEEREAARDPNRVAGLGPLHVGPAADAERRAGRSVSNWPSIAASLAGCSSATALALQVARERLEQGRRRADQQRDGERAAVEGVRPDRGGAGRRGCRPPRSRWRRRRRASCAASAGTPAGSAWRRSGRCWRSGRSPARSRSACSSRRWRSPRRCPDAAPLTATMTPAQQVGARRDPVPAVEIDAEEDRLGEEGEALERERHADDRARRPP